MKNSTSWLVYRTCKRQRFHIFPSFSSESCEWNRQSRECRAETASKAQKYQRKKEKFLFGREALTNQK